MSSLCPEVDQKIFVFDFWIYFTKFHDPRGLAIYVETFQMFYCQFFLNLGVWLEGWKALKIEERT